MIVSGQFSQYPNSISSDSGIGIPHREMRKHHANVEDWIWELFLNSCRLKGIEASLGVLPAHLRASHKKALEKAAEITWQPDKLWEKWESYLVKSGVLTDG